MSFEMSITRKYLKKIALSWVVDSERGPGSSVKSIAIFLKKIKMSKHDFISFKTMLVVTATSL